MSTSSLRVYAAVAFSAANIGEASYWMDCKGAPLCGVLALQSGFGPGNYKHEDPEVHGLWPQVDDHGNSQCIKPDSYRSTNQVYGCYRFSGNRAMWFENHEWDNHGVCAGADSEDDFFAQVCALSDKPLDIMEDEERTGFDGMIDALKDAGYAVWSVDHYNMQVQLSACANKEGRWKLAAQRDFYSLCGPGADRPHGPPHGPPAGSGSCVPGKRGPKCSNDGDCWGLSGCQRCARSGYCTNIGYMAASTMVKKPREETFNDTTVFVMGGFAGIVATVTLFFAVRAGRRSTHEDYLVLG